MVSSLAMAIAGVPMLVALPLAAAAPSASGSGSSGVHCETEEMGESARLHSDRDVPHWRQHHDTSRVTADDLAALPVQQTRRGVARQVASRLPATVTIPVYMHVIKGNHKREQQAFGPRRAQNLMNILNRGMAGQQSQDSAAARYRFALKKVTHTRRDGWYHAFFNGPRDREMKRKLHRGGASTLNVYINGGGPVGTPLLGWSRFPWQYASAPKLDAVTVNVASLPGGTASGYNLGDTLIHEVGHWLGLLHTFQGGCESPGDLVSDTPAEAEPSYYCQTTRDTCPLSQGLDPVRNFMDYSQDACMSMFTPGQVRRMDVAFERWRF